MLQAPRTRFQVETRRIGSGLSLTVAMEAEPRFRPGNGGTRFLPYASDGEAIADAYTLCQHMRFKHRLYDTGFRGAKLVARGEVTPQTKRVLLQSLVQVLDEFGGELFTGCDLNTGREDMEWVGLRSPYVLAALQSPVDASTATGRGVAASYFGAVRALRAQGFEDPTSALVHGCGATGRVVAERLVRAGLAVYTVDRVPERADVPGCINVSDDPDWCGRTFDLLFPCSISRLVTFPIAQRLRCRLVVSAANDPMTEAAEAELDRRGITWIPDPVSNAGAVIVDSVEHHAAREWRAASPEEVYRFVADRIEEVTEQIVAQARARGLSLKQAVESFADRGCAVPIGRHFHASRPLSESGRPAAVRVSP